MNDNKIIHNKNFFIFTGGPGVGKTTVLDELKKRNFHCAKEAARQIIKEQPKEISSDPVWRKSLEFSELSLNRSVETFLSENSGNKGITFFDRGIIDCISHPQLNKSAARQFLYNKTVFIFPPWKEIYHTDEERIQSYEESIEVYYKCKKIYKEYDYELLEVPKADVKVRADFIIENAQKLK
jgi:predicted ATPase